MHLDVGDTFFIVFCSNGAKPKYFHYTAIKEVNLTPKEIRRLNYGSENVSGMVRQA